MLTLLLLSGSTLLLLVWGILDLIEAWREQRQAAREGHPISSRFWRFKDGAFLILLAVLDGTAAAQQRAELASVEAKLMPRHLTATERNQMLASLRGSATAIPVWIIANADETAENKDEQQALAEELTAVFRDAGWTVHYSEAVYQRGTQQPRTGIGVWETEPTNPELEKAFAAVGNAMPQWLERSALFASTAAAQHLNAPTLENEPEPHVEVFIFRRPM